jgi:diaminopimelate decarboxylase
MTEPLMRTMIAAFEVVDGQLALGGVPLERLAARVGSTPFFAYDRRLLTKRVAQLKEILPSRIELGYAMKANPMPAVVQHLARLVDSIDVASALEMRTALDTPMPAHRITFAGPGKTDEEIEQAVAADVLIEMESRTEAQRVLLAGERLGITPRVALRVNPNFAVKGSGMRMGGGPQQFGVDAEEVPDLLAELASTGMDFVGFHVFAGSQNLHATILCDAQRQTVDLMLELAQKAPGPITYLNLGGGFGIPYFEKDEPLNLAPIADNLHHLLTEHIQPHLPDARICLELGRYLVGEAGVYVTRVIDRKESRGQLYLVVDGGMHHQLAASGNFGQVIRRNYPLALGNRLTQPADTTATVVGCLCTPLDLLGDKVQLPNPHIGDLVVVFQAGAYGLTASPTAFLGHPPAAEVLL